MLHLFIFKNILQVQGLNQWKAKNVTEHADKDVYDAAANFDTKWSFK